MKKYSILNKFLHRIYLKNYFISKSTLEYELDRFEDEIQNINLDMVVFVSGLARSGTTTLLRDLFSTNHFSSLQYNNMPFLFLPNTYKIKSSDKLSERAHNDGVKINGDSPEEFDEYFWKVYLNDSYINKDSLISHHIDDKVLKKYLNYAKLVCLSKNKTNYISKNNNNILRLSSLKNIPNSVFFFMVRTPLEQASSLLKLHMKFSKDQKEDGFSLEYFNFLGHHEFGLNQKIFKLDPQIFDQFISMDKSSIDYWLLVWKQYYSYLLSQIDNQIHVLTFDSIVSNKQNTYSKLSSVLGIEIKTGETSFSPPAYKKYNSDILEECKVIYKKLEEIRLG